MRLRHHQGTKGTKERQVQGPIGNAQPFGPEGELLRGRVFSDDRRILDGNPKRQRGTQRGFRGSRDLRGARGPSLSLRVSKSSQPLSGTHGVELTAKAETTPVPRHKSNHPRKTRRWSLPRIRQQPPFHLPFLCVFVSWWLTSPNSSTPNAPPLYVQVVHQARRRHDQFVPRRRVFAQELLERLVRFELHVDIDS